MDTVMDSTEAGFRERLAENPKDWELRRIYADWLEDHDQPVRACGQRWQADHEKRPLAWGRVDERADRNVGWWDSKFYTDPTSNLPEDVWVVLFTHATPGVARGKHSLRYGLAVEAEDALALVVWRMKDGGNKESA